ncbi:MAG: hypothetical protein OEY20_07600 [Gemmatimonadota bacterium]|nr:hypothetical protein [Gemmatimonadota bacterium]MDH5197097.1 hypothetical protein [Gemmatimonadota bacterium]
MTAVVRPATDPSTTDRSDVRLIVLGGVQLGIVTSVGVTAFALLSRTLAGPAEVVVQAVLLVVGGIVFSYAPSLGVRPRTVDGIAWATLVGLLGALVFTVIDTALLRPLQLYHWSWDAIGGGSGFWYIPVWWMGSAVLAWLGALVVATVARGGREPAPLVIGLLTAGLAIVLFGLGVAVRLLPFHAASMALAVVAALVLHVAIVAVTARR